MQRHFVPWLAVLLMVVPVPALAAQAEASADEITLVVGRSTVVKAPWPTIRVAVTDPKVADVQALTPEQVLVQDLRVGSTDLILWSDDEQKTWQRRIVVRLDAATICSSVQGLFPGGALSTAPTRPSICRSTWRRRRPPMST